MKVNYQLNKNQLLTWQQAYELDGSETDGL